MTELEAYSIIFGFLVVGFVIVTVWLQSKAKDDDWNDKW